MKITFKKDKKPSGLFGVGHRPNTRIKVDGKIIGYISSPAWNTDNFWKVHISIVKKNIMEDGNPNCSWRWFVFRENFPDEKSAREYILKKLPYFMITNELYYDDEIS